MDNAMADRVDTRHRLCQSLEHIVQRLDQRSGGPLELEWRRPFALNPHPRGAALPFDMRFPGRPWGLDWQRARAELMKPTFERARSAVNDQDSHLPGHCQSRISG